MKSNFLRLVIVLGMAPALALSGAEQAPAQPAAAAPRAPEQCIAYQDDNAGGYRLVNECDYAISVSWCAEITAGGCSGNQGWQSGRIEPRASLPGQFVPAQAINLFACRPPATARILAGGMGQCEVDPGTGDTPLPWLATAALKNPAAIITPADYPTKLQNLSGTTRFDMTVGADGRPISCSVTASSGHAELDNTACKAFLKRARFSPAKDERGKAIAGRYKGAVTWKAP